MALTRKYLKAMGIEDEKIDQIIEAHTDTVGALKDEISTYKADAEKLADVQKELDDLKAKGDGGYKEKYESEKKAHDKYRAEVQARETKAAKEQAYRMLLKQVGVKDKFLDTVIRADSELIDGIKLADGKIADSDKLTEDIKRNWSDFVTTTTTVVTGTETPPGNNGGSAMTKADILKIKDTAERQKAWADYITQQKGE